MIFLFFPTMTFITIHTIYASILVVYYKIIDIPILTHYIFIII